MMNGGPPPPADQDQASLDRTVPRLVAADGIDAAAYVADGAAELAGAAAHPGPGPLPAPATAPPAPAIPNDLIAPYHSILDRRRLDSTSHFPLLRLLGSGGQGSVYLTELRGSEQFTVPVALKIFSPAGFASADAYAADMNRVALVAGRIAQIQHSHLLYIHNFLDRNRIRIMLMEWVDGFDLNQLLVPEMLRQLRERVSEKRWEYINRVIVTEGPEQPRLKPGIAMAIVRDCLTALAAVHREGIVHGDMKPANIMLKRTGHTKLIDFGSSFLIDQPTANRMCTPSYAAPEVLAGEAITPLSDLASLGYVLIELLSGRRLFQGLKQYRPLLEAKRSLPQRLPQILPHEVTVNDLLMKFCRRLIAVDPSQRFPSAEAAELRKDGAAAFHRQLVLGDLASEYHNEIRLWLSELKQLEERPAADFHAPTRTL